MHVLCLFHVAFHHFFCTLHLWSSHSHVLDYKLQNLRILKGFQSVRLIASLSIQNHHASALTEKRSWHVSSWGTCQGWLITCFSSNRWNKNSKSSNKAVAHGAAGRQTSLNCLNKAMRWQIGLAISICLCVLRCLKSLYCWIYANYRVD